MADKPSMNELLRAAAGRPLPDKEQPSDASRQGFGDYGGGPRGQSVPVGRQTNRPMNEVMKAVVRDRRRAGEWDMFRVWWPEDFDE